MTCGIENAAAVSSEGQLLLWGNKCNLPRSMLPDAKSIPPLAKLQQQQQQGQGKGVEQGSGASVNSNAAAEVGAVHVPLALRLHVQGNGVVRVALQVHKQRPGQGCISSSGSGGGNGDNSNSGSSSSADGRSAESPASLSAKAHDTGVDGSSRLDGKGPSKGGAAPADLGRDEGLECVKAEEGPERDAVAPAFDPDKEHIRGMACGRSHFVMMCEKSMYVPSAGKVGGSMLAAVLGACDRRAAVHRLQAHYATQPLTGAQVPYGRQTSISVLPVAQSLLWPCL